MTLASSASTCGRGRGGPFSTTSSSPTMWQRPTPLSRSGRTLMRLSRPRKRKRTRTRRRRKKCEQVQDQFWLWAAEAEQRRRRARKREHDWYRLLVHVEAPQQRDALFALSGLFRRLGHCKTWAPHNVGCLTDQRSRCRVGVRG